MWRIALIVYVLSQWAEWSVYRWAGPSIDWPARV